jgi:hypothetical protein
MRTDAELFCAAFSNSGSIRASCDCGREHFEPAGDFELGELEELWKCCQRDPDRYVCQDHVSIIRVNGKQFVMDCPCKGYLPYAKFIWSHRQAILEYLKARATQDLELAQFTCEQVLEAEKALQASQKTVLPE